jgi:UDP-3-O-acyl-N-acetylglucosamine deacetylase
LCDETYIASPFDVTDTSRCTKLGPISVVEHILSALAGMGLTDADIDLTEPELPALDGAAREYADGVGSVGFEEIGRIEVAMFERVFFIETPIRIAIAAGTGHWRFDFECDDRWPRSQSYEAQLDPETYRTEIAPARTFAFEEEVEPLRAAGLGQGLDRGTALILGRDGYMNRAKWPDEPARHKMLDLIGDLALAGVPPFLVDVVAVRSGHRANVAAAQRLAKHVRVERL